jgi:ATP-dependent helicase/nuclease subunit A
LAEELEAVPKFPVSKFTFPTRKLPGKLSATEVGNAHHLFLQLISLEQAGSLAGLKAEAKRLELEQALSAEEAAELDLNALAQFWQSDLGKKILAQSKHARRELAFTARFSQEELDGTQPPPAELFDEEFVVVQGVADLVVLLPEEIWLVDFKTDQLKPADLPAKVKLYELQLRLYARALSRIYRRPVSEMHLHFLALKRTVEVKPAN